MGITRPPGSCVISEAYTDIHPSALGTGTRAEAQTAGRPEREAAAQLSPSPGSPSRSLP